MRRCWFQNYCMHPLHGSGRGNLAIKLRHAYAVYDTCHCCWNTHVELSGEEVLVAVCFGSNMTTLRRSCQSSFLLVSRRLDAVPLQHYLEALLNFVGRISILDALPCWGRFFFHWHDCCQSAVSTTMPYLHCRRAAASR
jgi:hypothetical protein